MKKEEMIYKKTKYNDSPCYVYICAKEFFLFYDSGVNDKIEFGILRLKTTLTF